MRTDRIFHGQDAVIRGLPAGATNARVRVGALSFEAPDAAGGCLIRGADTITLPAPHPRRPIAATLAFDLPGGGSGECAILLVRDPRRG